MHCHNSYLNVCINFVSDISNKNILLGYCDIYSMRCRDSCLDNQGCKCLSKHDLSNNYHAHGSFTTQLFLT
jgi:hypothetical protein